MRYKDRKKDLGNVLSTREKDEGKREGYNGWIYLLYLGKTQIRPKTQRGKNCTWPMRSVVLWMILMEGQSLLQTA